MPEVYLVPDIDVNIVENHGHSMEFNRISGLGINPEFTFKYIVK